MMSPTGSAPPPEMRRLPRLLLTTAFTVSLALPVSAQEVETVRIDDPSGSPLLGGALLALLMLGVAGIGSDGGGAQGTGPDPGPDLDPDLNPDPDYAPPGGYRGALRPRYVIGVTPFERDPELGTGGMRASFDTPEYFEGWGLDRIGAAARYAEGAFGAVPAAPAFSFFSCYSFSHILFPGHEQGAREAGHPIFTSLPEELIVSEYAT